MEIKIDLSEQEITDIRIARNYFGENDKTPHQHMCYAILDNLLKKINGDTEKRTNKSFCGCDDSHVCGICFKERGYKIVNGYIEKDL